jgi:hypothetical protein
LPVGSSASTQRGFVTSARASATRWRSPPGQLAGPMLQPMAEADALERGGGLVARLRGRHADG